MDTNIEKQYIQQVFELLAVVTSPILLYIGLNQKDRFDKIFLVSLAILQIFIDGYLLYSWTDAYKQAKTKMLTDKLIDAPTSPSSSPTDNYIYFLPHLFYGFIASYIGIPIEIFIVTHIIVELLLNSYQFTTLRYQVGWPVSSIQGKSCNGFASQASNIYALGGWYLGVYFKRWINN